MRITTLMCRFTLAGLLLIVAAGCSTAAPATAEVDACSLLTREEVAAVQGAMPSDAQGSVHASGDIRVAQCFFTLPDYASSVSLEVTTPIRGSARSLWKQRFAERDDEDEERREHGAAATPEVHSIEVEGVGRAARWTGNRVSGGLYVLTRSAILRISVGGPGDAATKITRAKQLAARAVARLR
jgi:hypothetical protein